MAKKVGNTYYFTGKGKSSGGGGGGGDAVLYTEQTLAESQQMQARKNQGLYYSEGGGEDVTINWDGDTTGLESLGDLLYKVSEDAPLASEFKSVSFIKDGVEDTFEVGSSGIQVSENGEVWVISKEGEPVCIVVTADEVTEHETTYTKGIWFVYGNENNRTSKLVYGQTETVHPVEPKFLPISTSLSGSSTDEEVPSAKTVYDIVGDVETLLSAL